jgi:DNA replication protein DnaC
VANLLRQQQSPHGPQPPLQLKDPELNQLTTDPLSLLDYDASISARERNPMTTLEQKLQQLNLTAMSQQLERTLAEAATRNLSLAATPEALADLEPEARHQRAIERRFRLSRLQPSSPLTALTSIITSRGCRSKTASCACWTWTSSTRGTNVVIIGNPGTGKTYLAKILAWQACRANQRVLFTTARTCSTTCWRPRSITP